MYNPVKLLLAACTLFASAGAWGADRELTLSGGSGSEADPYLISTKADILELAEACNTPEGTATNGTTASHYSGVHFLMTADIDLGGDGEFIGIATAPAKYAPGTTWKFQGIFDGGGHTVSGMNINGVTFDDTGKAQTAGAARSRSYVGFFGYLDGAVVRNLNIAADCVVEAYAYAGSVAGYSDKGSVISNCTSLATLKVYDGNCGGIVGRVNSAKTTPATIENCYFGGSVSCCNMYIGGIAGYVSGVGAVMTRCVNMGSVTAQSFNSIKAEGKQSVAGGIAGYYGGEMSECYNVGAVFASEKNAGGLVGNYITKTSVISSSINLGSVTTPDAVSKGVLTGGTAGTFSNCYFDAQMWGKLSGAGKENEGANGVATSVLTSGTLPTGLEGASWVCESGFYPRPAWIDRDILRRAAATYMKFADGQSAVDFTGSATISTAMSGIAAAITEGTDALELAGGTLSVKPIDDVVTASVTITNGDYKLAVPVVARPVFFTGTGTAEDPYIIDSPRALRGLAQMCSGVMNNHFAGTYFRQTADIDLTGDNTFHGIGTIEKYVAVGSMQTYFQGIYDGGGHTIKGLVINGATLGEDGKIVSTTSYASAGLFGALRSGAAVRNVVLDASCAITGYNNVGGIAGEVGEDVTIENCRSAATVKSYGNYCGGIVGHTTVASAGYVLNNIAITGCIATGKVATNGYYVGGIVGTNDAVVTGCVNGATVSQEVLSEAITLSSNAYAGGIAGYNGGSIYNCLNMGVVTANGNNVGGITGQNTNAHKRGNMVGNINAGQVISTAASAGAIAGNDNQNTTSPATLAPNWYDTQYSGKNGTGTSTGSGTHIDATGLLQAELTGAALPEGADGFSAAAGRYPLPVAVGSSDEAVAIAATYLILGDNETTNNFSQGTLPAVVPLTVRIPEGEETFYTADGRVLTHAIEAQTSGSVILQAACYERQIFLTALPGILPGAGTADEPYVIATAADFIALAMSVQESGYDYSGRYFRLSDDLDFAGVELVPVGSSVNPFAGIVDGADHTVKNIDNPAPDDKMQRERALFGYIGAKGAVKGIRLAASNIRGNLNTGGIVGILAGTVEDCSVGEDCIVYSIPSKIDTSNPVVYNGNSAGGIAAHMLPGARISGCSNSGTVAAEHEVGGIAGGGDQGNTLITGCSNYGTVGGVADPTELFSGNAMAGGIAGRVGGIVSDCVNHGRVVSTQMNNAAGIVGLSRPGLTITGCSNSGLIQVQWMYGGGILGISDENNTADSPVTVTGCHNEGTLDVMAGAGGIVGCANSYTCVRDCYNIGDIVNRDGAMAAGIVASSTGIVEVSRCYNLGKMDATRSASGIVADCSGNGLVVDRCFNAGEISATSTNELSPGRVAAGIANSYFEGTMTITNCYNLGSVSSLSEVGGIAGFGYHSVISNCYNLGTVTGNSLAGNIIGKNDGTSLTACYISDECPAGPADGDAPRLTDAELMQADLGDAWLYETACLPRLKDFATLPVVAVNSARYLVAEGETSETVASPVTLGSIEGLSWSVSGPAEIDGDRLTPTDKGEIKLTALAGDYTREYALTSVYDKEAAGIGIISADSPEVVAWYDLSGRRLAVAPRGEVAIAMTRAGKTVKVLVK